MFRSPIAIAIALTLSLFFTSAASAGPKRDSGLSGTIELAGANDAAEATAAASGTASTTYGETVWFSTTVAGSTQTNSELYVLVVCTQGSTVVYQWSGTTDFGFPLADQAGQGLDWDGSDADCTASLVYRVQKGRKVNISILDETHFAVSPTA